MSDDDSPDFHTRSLHTGQSPDDATGACAPPLRRITSYVLDDVADAAAQFALEKPGHIYLRLINSTVGMLQERLASSEGGVGAVAMSFGMAALDLATFLLALAGDNIVSASSLYGGTYAHPTYTAEHRGVMTRFVDTLDVDVYEVVIDDDTVSVHLETIGNLAFVTPDIEAIAEVAHDHGMPLLVDNTFATPYLCSPIEHDADPVWESMTKWIHGVGTTIGGILVDGGSFPRDEYADGYPGIARPNSAHHGINFDETFDPAGLTYVAIARGLRDLGNAQSPFDVWQTLEKLGSLPLRMRAHRENTQAVAEFLDDHEKVSWVNYPGLDSHETHEEALKYLDDGYSGMITFGPTDGCEAAKGTVNNVELALLLINVGNAKMFVIHPAPTTHQQLINDEQVTAGVMPDTVRLSIGVEDIDDIVDDLDQAIRAASN